MLMSLTEYQEVKEFLVDDALFNKGEITDTGTGSVLARDEFTELEQDDDHCPACGRGACETQPDVGWHNSDNHAYVQNMEDLTADEAFALGLQMGLSGEFDDLT